MPLGLPLAAASKVDRKVYVAKLGPESKRRGLGRSGLGLAWPHRTKEPPPTTC